MSGADLEQGALEVIGGLQHFSAPSDPTFPTKETKPATPLPEEELNDSPLSSLRRLVQSARVSLIEFL